MSEATLELFKQNFQAEPEQLAFAPGRIEFIGNHTDYNGGLVMGAGGDRGDYGCWCPSVQTAWLPCQ